MLTHLASEGQQMYSTSSFYMSNLTVLSCWRDEVVILITGVKLFT